MKSAAIDAYLASFPPPVRARLAQVRRTIRAAVPKASEVVSYGIPACRLDRVFIFFAGFKNHIGLYPPVRGDARLEKAVARYAGPKGNLQFPHDAPLPLALIGRIARFKARQDRARTALRKKKK